MMPFNPDPNIRYLDTIDELPVDRFMALRDHPAQRQTTLHAATLMTSGVLGQALDQHREVDVILIGQPDKNDTIESLIGIYEADREDAFARHVTSSTDTHALTAGGWLTVFPLQRQFVRRSMPQLISLPPLRPITPSTRAPR
jgi:hypothetical protein